MFLSNTNFAVQKEKLKLAGAWHNSERMCSGFGNKSEIPKG